VLDSQIAAMHADSKIDLADVAPGLALPQWTIDESAAAARRGDTAGRRAQPVSRTPALPTRS